MNVEKNVSYSKLQLSNYCMRTFFIATFNIFLFLGCFILCPKMYNPVCGSDGVTHASNCTMHLAACEQHKEIAFISNGPC